MRVRLSLRIRLSLLCLLFLSGCDAFSSATGSQNGVEIRYVVEGDADVSYLRDDHLEQTQARGTWETRFEAESSAVLSLEATSSDGEPIHARIEVEGVVVHAQQGVHVQLDSRGVDRSDGIVEVHGPVGALAADRVTVLGRVFVVDAQTRLLDRANEPVELSRFTPGTVVEAEGRLASDGTVQAKAIKIRTEDTGTGHHETEVDGRLDEIQATSIVVNGTRFAVDAATRWLDDDNDPINRLAFVVGERVEAEGYVRGGVLYAEKVKKHD
ncbi:MAG: hypothetical protein Rubg2KO_29440 [Rubricoccaceae bacterium]